MEYPVLSSSNPYFENFFKYRWENIARLSFLPNGKIYRYPGVYEGAGYFKKHISYSAHAHMRELRWLKDPSLAQGSILNFVANQRKDGSFPGHLEEDSIDEESFYHADWGAAVLELNLLRHDSIFLEKVYVGLSRYAKYFNRERDPENCCLYDVWNHFETGQEFSSRYTAVDLKADRNNWGRVFRLKGVDATIYMYEIWQCLGKIAAILKKDAREKKYWEWKAKKTKTAILKFMWSNYGAGMFFDVNPETMKPTGVKALTCFYPYITDIVSQKHLTGMIYHLFCKTEFLTPYPFPTLSLDDPNFSPEGIWRGKKQICPWNGRVWPMTNSHIAEAIAQCAIRFKNQWLRQRFVEFFETWIKMMSFEKNPERPNSFEHYHPFCGAPSTQENGFGGYNDYLHSWINDLIIKYVAGFRPLENNKFVVDPFPFRTEISLSGIWWLGQIIDIAITDNRATIRVNGKIAGESSAGKQFIFSLENIKTL